MPPTFPRRRGSRARLRRRWLGVESLEDRLFLSASPSSPEDAIGPVVWNGQQTVAYRDSYIVKMPTTQVANSDGYLDYVSSVPAVEPGWSAQSIGMGFYNILTPGVSQQDVSAWATTVGAVSVEPNQVLVKQALTATPNDSAYKQYLWGLNNTGVGPNLVSIESRAAAALGNGADDYPRQRDADIDAPEAWYIQTGTRQVIVAVFDDGIDDTNPDLAQNMWTRPASVPLTWKGGTEPFVGKHGFNSAEWLNPANGVDLTPTIPGVTPGINAFYEGSSVAPYSGRDFVATRPGDIALLDRNRVVRVPGQQAGTLVPRQYASWRGANDVHGTHVAGIIGAGGNNAFGVTGVNWAVSLYSANIFRYGDFDPDGNWRAADQTGSVAAFIDAVHRIVELKTRYNQNFAVANMSFNTYTFSQGMSDAIGELAGVGILSVVAAGNGYDPCLRDGVGDRIGTGPCPDLWTYPAGYKGTYPNSMIVVTSSSAIDKLPRFANWGPNVEIAAPGENIWSTVPLSARQYQPGLKGLLGGPSDQTVPVQQDTFEPFYLSTDDPIHPTPPSGSGVTFTEICPVPLNAGVNPDDAVWTADFSLQHNIISRPMMFREVPRPMQQAPLLSKSEAYASMSGTSASTAYVSGVAALMAAEFYRWTNTVPNAAYLKQGLITQADVVSTLTYQEGDNFPPDDFQHLDKAGAPIARTGMYETPTDPFTRLHRIGGGASFPGADGSTVPVPNDLRVNAYKCVDWVRYNLPASLSFITRLETADNRGESRLEGDIDPALPTPQYWQLYYSAQFVAGTGIFIGMTLPAIPLDFVGWTSDKPKGPNSATGGVDYVSIPEVAAVPFTIPVVPAGTRFYDIPNFSVSVICDNTPENDESFYVNFRLIPNPAIANTQSIWVRTRTVGESIIDDDATDAKPAVRVSPALPTKLPITEGDGGVGKPTWEFVTFNLDRVARRTVLVPYQIRQGVRSVDAAAGVVAATEGEDFLGASLTARIPAGQKSVKVPVYVIGDTTKETAEQFQVVLGKPNFGVKKRGTSIAFVDVADDDTVVNPPPSGAPTLTIAGPAPVTEGNAAVFGLTLSGPVPAGDRVVVTYNVLDGTATGGRDFLVPAAPRTVTIPAGSATGSITVTTVTDRLVESSETFSVQILSATLVKADTSTAVVPIVSPSTITATILDANTPPAAPNVALALAGPAAVTEGDTALFDVVLQLGGGGYTIPAGYAVQIFYSVLNGTATVGSDVAGSSSRSIVLPAGSSTGTIAVVTLADRLVEGDETFSVQLTRAILYKVGSTTSQALAVQGPPVSMTINDANT